ncbi:type II toxin-antitoxin system RelE/ParE family toxin [Candidatus Aerophobetes bacterium]|nr:type II toxin-antitoxin system RelE/ParE family toxin [Candidatus Aerophobetes bacterium]
MYRIESISAVKRDIHKLDKQLQKTIQEKHLLNIEKEPFKAIPLFHGFKGLWSYHFNYSGTQYRIVYEVYSEDKIVMLIMIGPREGFYQALKSRIK